MRRIEDIGQERSFACALIESVLAWIEITKAMRQFTRKPESRVMGSAVKGFFSLLPPCGMTMADELGDSISLMSLLACDFEVVDVESVLVFGFLLKLESLGSPLRLESDMFFLDTKGVLRESNDCAKERIS
jgi:hypothetical protein